MTDIGDLTVRIKADATQLQQELSKATQTTKNSANDMAGAFDGVKGALGELGIALSAGALLAYGKSAVETASNLQNMADRIGFSASTLAALQPILAHSGSSIEELSHSVYMMNNAIQMAIEGNPKAIQAFNDLGLSATKLKAMRPEDAFNAVIDALYRLDDINKQTEVGRALFSRSYASLIPLVKQSQGALEDYTEAQKKAVPDDAAIERVHEFGNALEDSAIRAKDAMIELLAVLLKIHDSIPDFEQLGVSAGNSIRNFLGMGANPTSPNLFGSNGKLLGQSRPGDLPGHAASYPGDNVPSGDKSGRGSNADITPPGKDSELKAYIASLNQETAALGLNQKALTISKAEIEGTAKAKADYDNGIRSSKDLTSQEKEQIDNLAASYYDLKKAQEEAQQQAQKMQQTLASALTEISTNFKNMGTIITSVLQKIASEMITDSITSPLSKALIGNPASGQQGLFSGLFSSFSLSSILPHFASGDTITGPSIVGENGPELFMPPSAGTIVPNGQFGGGGVSLHQTIVMQPGLAETVTAAIRNAAPSIAAMAHAGVMQAIQRGGPDARIVGLRSS